MHSLKKALSLTELCCWESFQGISSGLVWSVCGNPASKVLSTVSQAPSLEGWIWMLKAVSCRWMWSPLRRSHGGNQVQLLALRLVKCVCVCVSIPQMQMYIFSGTKLSQRMLCINAGADLSDYFNYGFNEDTWKAYCDKQRRLEIWRRLEILSLASSSKLMVHLAYLKYALISIMMF